MARIECSRTGHCGCKSETRNSIWAEYIQVLIGEAKAFELYQKDNRKSSLDDCISIYKINSGNKVKSKFR